MRVINWNKYIFTFIITATIFATALFASSYFNDKRVKEVRGIAEKISIDILSLETQFALLEDLSCGDIEENSVLSKELNSLQRRLTFTEGQLGTDNKEVGLLKQSYSLLQIKDYLLMKRISEKCSLAPVFVFYFYSNAGDCPDCTKEGHVLTYLREQYPKLRVYSFDYNLDLSAIQTLISINDVKYSLPAIVIGNDVRYGFQSIEDLESLLPIEELKASENKSATSSPKKTQ